MQHPMLNALYAIACPSVKTVARITYTVLVETLNPAQSISLSVCLSVVAFYCHHDRWPCM